MKTRLVSFIVYRRISLDSFRIIVKDYVEIVFM